MTALVQHERRLLIQTVHDRLTRPDRRVKDDRIVFMIKLGNIITQMNFNICLVVSTIQDGELVYSEEETALSPQRWCMSLYANDPTSTANIPARIRIITTEDYANGCIAPASFLESNETIYDLTGRMVNGKWSNGKWKEGNLPRGIYIIGGRKVFVK